MRSHENRPGVHVASRLLHIKAEGATGFLVPPFVVVLNRLGSQGAWHQGRRVLPLLVVAGALQQHHGPALHGQGRCCRCCSCSLLLLFVRLLLLLPVRRRLHALPLPLLPRLLLPPHDFRQDFQVSTRTRPCPGQSKSGPLRTNCGRFRRRLLVDWFENHYLEPKPIVVTVNCQ